MLLPVRTLFAHQWLTMPQYILRAYDQGVADRMEWLVNWINPGIIFVGVPIATALTSGTVYWWRAEASDDGGATYGPFSTARSFTLEAPLAGIASVATGRSVTAATPQVQSVAVHGSIPRREAAFPIMLKQAKLRADARPATMPAAFRSFSVIQETSNSSPGSKVSRTAQIVRLA